ncbi:MAG: nucleotide sugar dehydrogenase [Acidimicrobiia bacterium]|nr:nucleotide sugar dehydrogenase [Acidimicrobiia bacterium]MDH4308872.1 nucleotide sugar dehydrogenase [Acidimicrobiia bacterium]MDH5294909.1 nucleotide sugar dehydrogenase [Acidimicrobiia bacterium]
MNDPVEYFSSEDWTLGVIGLGYVGLPLAVTASERGLGVIGFDVSGSRCAELMAGRSHVEDVSDGELGAALDRGARFTSDPTELGAADALVICVPSPLGRNRQPDLSYIEAAARTVESVLRPGQLVSLESTTYPGTTEDIVAAAVDRAGLTIDDDVWVVFSPERVSPGDTMKTGEIPKIVGGVTRMSSAVGAAAYSRIVSAVHSVSSARAAEMAKLLENTYRAVNIGLVNEMAQLAFKLDIDIWEVVDAAATKPFGFQPFYPGPGVGGHCIPLDPQYLAWRAKEANFATRFIDIAEQVNTMMPSYNADRIAALLNERGLPVFGTKILGVGIAYKPDIGDDRESASLDVLDELRRRGADVVVLDPLVGDDRIRHHGYEPAGDDLSGYALAAVLCDHEVIDYERLAASVPVVFDARAAYRKRGIEAGNVVPL